MAAPLLKISRAAAFRSGALYLLPLPRLQGQCLTGLMYHQLVRAMQGGK